MFEFVGHLTDKEANGISGSPPSLSPSPLLLSSSGGGRRREIPPEAGTHRPWTNPVTSASPHLRSDYQMDITMGMGLSGVGPVGYSAGLFYLFVCICLALSLKQPL